MMTYSLYRPRALAAALDGAVARQLLFSAIETATLFPLLATQTCLHSALERVIAVRLSWRPFATSREMFKLEAEWKWSLRRDVLPTDFVAVT
jgi:hypothetical protein